MPGKYRPVSTAEKRALLEAAGEEWPVGSDGEPKSWKSKSTRPSGGGWSLRSTRRSHSKSYKPEWTKTAAGQASRKRENANRIRIGGAYFGTINQFPAPREVVEATLRRSLAELHAKQAADKEAFNESVA